MLARADCGSRVLVWGCLQPIGLQSTLALENVGARKSRQHNSCLGMPQTDWFAMYVGAGECRRAPLAAAEFVFRGASNRLACRVHRRWRMSARASGGRRVFVWGCFKPIGAQNTLLASLSGGSRILGWGCLTTDCFAKYIGAGEYRCAQVAAA